ncbi:MAG: Holo-(acyl-carrier-protein) synthase [candidate division WS2 bacterium]|uniref:Holo-[acyl-carrier-protein] synthase n=1 Tax=Psychracetigena formicireducens TaxID=2986056 RepID=A0A9E2BJR1_PSYF1|nr:Holo-(acyl-carrier-protein) synthase [Candidatus Psychracetigena formicireducens]MBT9144369.1 Holo-(acyl-carrier-protein) synthase [Candidatus Psychracetigena formicireducens]
MIKGIGIDIVSIDRIKEVINRGGDRFPSRILSEKEMGEYSESGKSILYISGRFSIKEALIKAMGGYWKGFRFNTIEVLENLKGAPTIRFSEEVLILNPHFKNYKIHISLSHDGNMVVSQVVIEDV